MKDGSEDQLHKSVAEFLDVALPKSVFWSTFPAGGGGKVRGGKLKAKGLKAGVPDVLIIWGDEDEHMPHVLWIELKNDDGVVSSEQEGMHARLRGADCVVGVARTIDDVSRLLAQCGVPSRSAYRGR